MAMKNKSKRSLKYSSNTKKRNSNLRHTMKKKPQEKHARFSHSQIHLKDKAKIIATFIELLNTIRLFHWSTTDYTQHKATDELYSKLNDHIDEFVEILLGKDSKRVHMIEKRIDLIDVKSTNDLKKQIHEFREFLIDFDILFDERRDSDLLNKRDEILGNINQFLYLITLK
jgi:DNA-binding ferritin-like protein